MSPQLQTLINEARGLNATEQMELISAISQFLQKRYRINNNFWNAKTVKQHIEEQQIGITKSVSDLGVDFWPEEDSVDEFNEFIRQQRYDERLSE